MWFIKKLLHHLEHGTRNPDTHFFKVYVGQALATWLLFPFPLQLSYILFSGFTINEKIKAKVAKIAKVIKISIIFTPI
jgi:hypothetical protein